MAKRTTDGLRDGKDALRHARRSAPLPEKLRQIVQAQHLYVQVVGSRRPLQPLERPWDIQPPRWAREGQRRRKASWCSR